MQALDEGALGHVAEYFRALSEPLRLRLLNALREGPVNVGELTLQLGCSQANVSKHLALLAKSGLVTRASRGTSVYYQIADPRTYELCDLVCGQIAQRLMAQIQGLGGMAPQPTKASKAQAVTAGRAAARKTTRSKARSGVA